MLDPVMLEVKKLRTLQRKGTQMDKNKVVEKTRKYLVTPPTCHSPLWHYLCRITIYRKSTICGGLVLAFIRLGGHIDKGQPWWSRKGSAAWSRK